MRILVALIFSVCISAGAFAGPKEDVQATISAQLEAFLKDDFETAFTFASHPSDLCFKRRKTSALWSNAGTQWSGDHRSSVFWSIAKIRPDAPKIFRFLTKMGQRTICDIFLLIRRRVGKYQVFNS